MSKFILGLMLLLVSVTTFASNSSLDRSFAGTGSTTVAFDQFGVKRDYAQAIAQQPSGNYVIAGEVQTNTSTGMSIGLARINRTTGQEISRTVFDGGITNVRGVAVDFVGSTIVVGSTPTNADGAPDLAVLRFNSANNPDTSFGGDGGISYDIANLSNAADNPLAAVVRPSRQILVLVEETRNDQAFHPFVVLAISETASSIFALPLGSTGFNGGAMLLDSAGRLVVVINEGIGSCTRAKIYRFAPDTLANLDTGFGVSGVRTLPPPTGVPGSCTPTITSIALDASGRILLGGHVASLTAAASWAARLTANGTLDTTFNTDGWATVPRPISGDFQYTFGIGAELDGKVVLGGTFVFTNASIGQRPMLARLLSNGAPDVSFNPSVSTSVYSLGSNPIDQTGVAMLMDGERAVLVGATAFGTSGDYDYLILRNQGPLFKDGFE